MGRDGQEKLARKARARNREDRMNLKSHLIFSLYTIYGILSKGEPGTSGAYVRLCLCMYVRNNVCTRACYRPTEGQDDEGANARSHTGRGRNSPIAVFFIFLILMYILMRKCVRALNVRVYLCKCA